LATIYLGAKQTGAREVQRWSKPVYKAFIAGCWQVYWTSDTLYWVAKPTVHVDDQRRLHNDSVGALECDIENLYFSHGVSVPAFVIVNPGCITTRHILDEQNAEVRRVMIERYDGHRGKGRFIQDVGAKVIDSAVQPMRAGEPDAINELLSIDLPGDPDGRMVYLKMIDPSTGRVYMNRVHPNLRPLLGNDSAGNPRLGALQNLTVRNALASTHGMRGEEYVLQQES